ncbi:MAG: hypothetical protein ACD_75C00605G0001 [uncultured bacterium]|nr:MAG: hypothetical protein ACD_75C00605G0001 [uncultured bacterium]
MIRTSTSMVLPLPTRSKVFSWRTLSNFDCSGSGISPTSSRKMVPVSASSNLPLRMTTAPVKAPFSWPKSSLSSKFSERAAQLTAMKGCVSRGLFMWMALATSSLPVPLSPVIKTEA